MRETADILRRAKARIEDPEHWCQGEYARDARGEPVFSTHPAAVRWCAVGALRAELPTSEKPMYLLRKAFLEFAFKPTEVTEVNDVLGHNAVLTLYDRAIALAEAQL